MDHTFSDFTTVWKSHSAGSQHSWWDDEGGVYSYNRVNNKLFKLIDRDTDGWSNWHDIHLANEKWLVTDNQSTELVDDLHVVDLESGEIKALAYEDIFPGVKKDGDEFGGLEMTEMQIVGDNLVGLSRHIIDDFSDRYGNSWSKPDVNYFENFGLTSDQLYDSTIFIHNITSNKTSFVVLDEVPYNSMDGSESWTLMFSESNNKNTVVFKGHIWDGNFDNETIDGYIALNTDTFEVKRITDVTGLSPSAVSTNGDHVAFDLGSYAAVAANIWDEGNGERLNYTLVEAKLPEPTPEPTPVAPAPQPTPEPTPVAPTPQPTPEPTPVAPAPQPTPEPDEPEWNDIYGTKRHDELIGTNAADAISGGKGDDLIYGGGGDDLIIGGKGGDFLEGGTGEDWFATKKKFGKGKKNYDVITDFEVGEDVLMVMGKTKGLWIDNYKGDAVLVRGRKDIIAWIDGAGGQLEWGGSDGSLIM